MNASNYRRNNSVSHCIFLNFHVLFSPPFLPVQRLYVKTNVFGRFGVIEHCIGIADFFHRFFFFLFAWLLSCFSGD